MTAIKPKAVYERKKVFFIDDEVDLCLLMKTYFLRKNYEVYISHTLADAFPRLKECQPVIIYINTRVCRNPEEDIKRIKDAVPLAKIIVNQYNIPEGF